MHHFDDLVDVLGIQADGPGIDIAEALGIPAIMTVFQPKRLNSAALPSITGRAASGPRLPSPSTADPSVTTAMLFRLMVSRLASSTFLAIAKHTRATPGV